ncbi:DEAD/DEAH box helicase family protein [Paenibacillus glucanolyticus]
MSDNRGFLGRERLFYGPWQAFERAIARYLVHAGWEHVALIGGSGDNGGDVIASNGVSEVIYQVKFRTNGGAVGIEIVEDIKRAMEYYDIRFGCVVTNGYLSKGALDYLTTLKNLGYRIQVLEGKTLIEKFKSLPDSPSVQLAIREYQALAIDSVKKAFERGDRTYLLVLATGLGKTFVAGKFLSIAYNKYNDLRVLVLANKSDLIKQFDRAIWAHLPKSVSTHIWDESEKPAYSEGIILATFQSVYNHVKAGREMPFYNVVIIDECHHAGAETYNYVINELNPDFLLGLTATPFRTDDIEIRDIFGSPRFSMDIVKGMRHGFLAKVDYRIFSDNIDWDFVTSNSKKSLTIKNLNKQLFLPQRDEEVVSIVKEVWNREKTTRAIIFCSGIEHCKQIEKILLSYGLKARGLYSGMDPWEREQYLREFRQGKIKILVSVDILNEGIDVPEVDLVVFLRVTHSRIIFLQQLGRGLRLSNTKSKVIVLDFVSDIKRVVSLFSLNKKNQDFREEGIEIVTINNFNVSFSDRTSESFFESVIKDKFDIEDYDEARELFLP